jgi:hypothetical protein
MMLQTVLRVCESVQNHGITAVLAEIGRLFCSGDQNEIADSSAEASYSAFVADMEKIYSEEGDSPGLQEVNMARQILLLDYEGTLCTELKLSAKLLVDLFEDLLRETFSFIESAKLCRERDAERGCRIIPDYAFVHGLNRTETVEDVHASSLTARKRYEEIDPVLLSANHDYETLKSRVLIISKLAGESGGGNV